MEQNEKLLTMLSSQDIELHELAISIVVSTMSEDTKKIINNLSHRTKVQYCKYKCQAEIYEHSTKTKDN